MTPEQIAEVDDRPLLAVEVPEWGGGTIYLRALTIAETDQFVWQLNLETEKGSKADVSHLKARLLARAMVTADGLALFPDLKVGEAILAKKSPLVIDRLYDEARILSGMKKKKEVAAEAADVDQSGNS